MLLLPSTNPELYGKDIVFLIGAISFSIPFINPLTLESLNSLMNLSSLSREDVPIVAISFLLSGLAVALTSINVQTRIVLTQETFQRRQEEI